MTISIAARLKPYSHLPGTRLLIPGTPLVATCYPTRVVIEGVGEFIWPLQAIATSLFTVEQDLERGVIRVWCETDKGQLRYRLEVIEGQLVIKMERGEPPLVSALPINMVAGQGVKERLSLGAHKQLHWERVAARGQLSELLPVWMRLGQWMPAKRYPLPDLLKAVEQSIQDSKPEQIDGQLRSAFRIGFAGLMVPQQGDVHHWGTVSQVQEPLALLSEGMHLIRRLFIEASDDRLAILPCLPPQLHAGRMCCAATPWGEVDLEWSKKTIRRMVLRTERPVELTLRLQSQLKQFRMRTDLKDRGRTCLADETLTISGTCWFDRFER